MSAMEKKIVQGKGRGNSGRRWEVCIIRSSGPGGEPLEMINFEQRPGKGEGGSQGVFWWESIPERENSE